MHSLAYALFFSSYAFCLTITAQVSQVGSSEDGAKTKMEINSSGLGDLRNLSTSLIEYDKEDGKYRRMFVDSLNTWTYVSYSSSQFKIDANISVGYWQDGRLKYMTSNGTSLTSINYIYSSSLTFEIHVRNSYPGVLNLSVTVTKLDDGVYYSWTRLKLYSSNYGTNDITINQFKTKNNHAYSCAPQATILLGSKAVLLVKDLYYYVSFDTTKWPSQVDGCQGSLTYELYGVVGGLCGLLTLVTIATVIIRQRKSYKLQIAYENLDRRFQP